MLHQMGCGNNIIVPRVTLQGSGVLLYARGHVRYL